MPGFISDSPLARGLIRIGDEAIARADDVKLRAYYTEDYVFHGPGGDLGFEELRAYFASLRAAFSDGWAIAGIEAEHFELRQSSSATPVAQAWLASLQRL